MKKIILSLIVIISALCVSAKDDNPTPVYLVAGQSNTDGRISNDELPQYIQQNKYKHCYWSYGSGTLSGNGQFELF